MQRTPLIPEGGMTLADAFDQFWQARNANFLFTPRDLTNQAEADSFWPEYARRWDNTLAEFIRLALASGVVKVLHMPTASKSCVIPPRVFVEHRPFAGISSIATPGPRGEINEPAGDKLSAYNGCYPFVMAATFKAWLAPFDRLTRLEATEQTAGPKKRGRPRDSSPFNDAHLYYQMHRYQQEQRCSDHKAAQYIEPLAERAPNAKLESVVRRLREGFKAWKKDMKAAS